MKITALLFACCVALLFTAAPRTARADDVTFDVFYNSLSDDGEWYNTPDYGYVFQPDVAYNNPKWRPYTDGYWAQTEDGWTWVAYENFGWATYHYGRWTQLKDTGWVWVPGYEWGPGWVSWRTSDDKVGWAPLPPKVNLAYVDGKDVTEEAPRPRVSVEYNDVEEDYSTGYTPAVDQDYDIGPESYCFVETRHFGDPRLSEVILPPAENYVYVDNSVNVTYISYQSDHDRRFIYNRGPDFGFIRGRVDRPIQELRLDRHDDIGFLHNNDRGGNANRVHDGVLQVASPVIAHRAMDFQQVRPNKVKRTLDRPQILRGWQNVQAKDPQMATRLRDKIKEQASRPAIPGAAGAGRQPRPEAPSEPAQAAAPVQEPRGAGAPPPPAQLKNMTPEEHAARRAARQQARQQGAPAVQPGQPGAPAQEPGQPALVNPDKAARKAARQAAQQQQQAAPQEAVQPAVDPEKAARKAARQQQAQPAAQGEQQPAQADPDKAARKAARQQQAEQAQQAAQQQNAQQEQDKAARKAERQQQAQQAAQQQNAQQEQDKAARKAERQQQAQQAAQQQNAQQEQDKAARKAERQQQQAQQAQQMQQQQQRQQSVPQEQQRPQRSPEERAERQAARQQQQQPQPQPQQQQNGDKKKDKDKDKDHQ